MPLTTAECANLLNASTVAGTYSLTTATRLALETNATTPTASAAGTEVSGGSYSRLTCPFAATSNGTISNSGAVTFSGMPAGTVAYFAIYDSAGTPNRKWFGSLTTSRTLQAGDSIQFAASAISLGLS